MGELPALDPLDQLYQLLKDCDGSWLEQTLQERARHIASTTATESVASLLPPSAESTPLLLGPYDITAPALTPGRDVSHHVKAFRSHDWAATDLGAMSSWSGELRRIVNVCMADPRPAAVWWGSAKIAVYNEGYCTILGGRAELAMGMPFDKVWPEVAGTDFMVSFSRAHSLGESTTGDEACFFVERSGYLEELWASWSMIPVLGGTGTLGCYNPVVEVTRQVVFERSESTLLAVARQTTGAKDVSDFWSRIIPGLVENHCDVPFAAVYSATSLHVQSSQLYGGITHAAKGSTSSSSDVSPGVALSQWKLEGSLGVPTEKILLPEMIQADSAVTLFGSWATTPYLGTPQLLRIEDDTFPEDLRAIVKSRAYGDECREMVLIPIGRLQEGHRSGVLLLGINTRRHYDQVYERFIQLLARQLSLSFASASLAENEAFQLRLADELTAHDRKKLVKQLAVSQEDARYQQMRFRTMADYAPVAIFETDESGKLTYTNETWVRLTAQSSRSSASMSWANIISDEDRKVFDSQWTRLLAGEPVQCELRLKKAFVSDDFVDGQALKGETWILMAAHIVTHADGSVKAIVGCFVEISRQKWMERFQERRSLEALESKRQQENFMDMTNHEARNPLAAMMLCVESIIATVQSLTQGFLDRDTAEAILQDAKIISKCLEHQKIVLDDVLTLSKLGSGMLQITPVEVYPTEAVSNSLRMFTKELEQADIELHYDVAQSYRDLEMGQLLLDASRLQQIVMNLVSNAIRFTKNEARRHIFVSVDANTQRPSGSLNGLRYLKPTAFDMTPRSWDNDTVYLSVTVRDTGSGIPKSELEHLFQRFKQASPRTHVTYGGSGLGLFISKELVNMHGGQIGVTSDLDSGSTFAFFIRAARCKAQRPSNLEERTPVVGSHDQSLKQLPVRKRIKSALASLDSQPTGLKQDVAPLEPCHILVVEDNLVNQRVMVTRLRREGYTVSVANHGGEALEYIQLSRFCRPQGHKLDVVLLDIEMPVMDGLTCASRIRASESCGDISAHVPLIAVTANIRAEQQQAAIDAGVDAVVTKPFSMAAFLPRLDSIQRLHGATSR